MTELSIAIATESLPSVLGDCVTLYHKVGIAANDMRGCLLRHVRDTKLYKQDYSTFEAFAEAELGLSRRRAYELISDYEVRGNLCAIAHKPANEGQTRELAKLPADEQADAWEEVVEESETTGEKITAKKVEQVVARRKETRPAPEPKRRVVEPSGTGTLEDLFGQLEAIANKPNSMIVMSELRGVVAAIKALVL